MRRAPRYRASMFSATPAAKSNSGGAGAGCWLMPANARLNHVSRATGAAASLSIKWFNVDAERFSPAAIAAEALESPPLEPGESVIARASGVVLGWQPQTILIWWIPGLVFIALAWIQTASLVVTFGLAVFCAGLFLFYASDREVRPRGSHRQYVLTDRRLIIAAAGKPPRWRPLDLGDVASTRMEEGLADRVVRRVSGAAAIGIELRAPGPKGEPRRMRIGPLRQAELFW